MSYFYEMERGAKWDCDNFLAFGSKAVESPRKLQLADWNFVDDGEIDTGSFNPNTSSVKSSISASTDSSTRNQIQTPNIGFVTFDEDSSGKVSKNLDKMQTYAGGTCQPLEPSFGSVEPLIGLKLGKRTYFENRGTAGYVKDSSLSVMSSPSAITQKRKKSYARNAPTPFCQVEGCNMDLSTAKDYHRKHRVCDIHSKCPKVIVGGLERRFCQQCSSFHGLFYFDGKKRSCRNRLSDHNARRRKPRPKDIHFDSSSLSSPLFGGTQQLSSVLDNSPFINSMRTPTNSMWGSTWSSKFSLTKDIKLPHLMNMHDNATTGFFASKSSTPEVLSPGGKGGSLMSSYLDVAAPECDRRALSLLSNSSWGSCGPQSVPLHHHPMHENDTSTTYQYPMIPEFWPTQCPNLHGQSLAASSNFQLFKTPRESDFHSNLLN